MARSQIPVPDEAARRYAAALFDLALASGSPERTAEELSGLAALFAASDELRMAMRAPVVPVDEKVAVLRDLCERGGAGDLTRRFVAVVARAGRARDIPAMAVAFAERVSRHHGRVGLIVRTAREVGVSERDGIAAALREAVGAETDCRFETDVGLIGGVQIREGSRLIDASLRAGLRRMLRALAQA